MGIQDKKPRTIVEAIRDWATTFGPSEIYDLSQLKQVHGYFDAKFRSNAFTQNPDIFLAGSTSSDRDRILSNNPVQSRWQGQLFRLVDQAPVSGSTSYGNSDV
jgi:hypothetical protein